MRIFLINYEIQKLSCIIASKNQNKPPMTSYSFEIKPELAQKLKKLKKKDSQLFIRMRIMMKYIYSYQLSGYQGLFLMIDAAFLISVPILASSKSMKNMCGKWEFQRKNYAGTIAREPTGQFFVHIPHAMQVSSTTANPLLTWMASFAVSML